MRSLLVEDDAVPADALARALVQSAHAVDTVGNGDEAGAALALGRYDLAIIDIGLPGSGGVEVLKRLLARRSTMPVLVLLMMRAGWVDSKAPMVNHVCGWGDEVAANPIEVNVDRLREKLGPLGCEIRTVRAMGYLMDRQDQPS